MTRILLLFHLLEQENIRYCVLRDAEEIIEGAEIEELDLLVDKRDMSLIQNLLTNLEFVKLPSWGYTPHHFFVTYDSASEHWLKLDIITEIVYGQPIPTLHTMLAQDCLERRQHYGSTYVPAPECELITLLLHCLLDKGYFAPVRALRIQKLRQQIKDEDYLAKLLDKYWQPTMSWQQLAAVIDTAQWAILMATRKELAMSLAAANQHGVKVQVFGQRLVRKWNRWFTGRRPRSLSVAVLAPDGAGKSTLISTLQNSFYFPVHTVYMGLYQKGNTGSALPGTGLLQRVVLQWRRYLVARYHQMRRRLVIFDRYTYDALLPSRQSRSYMKQWRRRILAYTCPSPDLVIFLDAPGTLLFERKGEHSAAILEEQRQFYLGLQSALPQMVMVDATQTADQVRQNVTAIIWRAYIQRQKGLRPHTEVERSTLDLCTQE